MEYRVASQDRAGDGAMATVEYRVAHGGDAAGNVKSVWETGAEIESSTAQRRPLTFEVGSRMVLPLLDHAVRRLAVGEETCIDPPHPFTDDVPMFVHACKLSLYTRKSAATSDPYLVCMPTYLSVRTCIHLQWWQAMPGMPLALTGVRSMV